MTDPLETTRPLPALVRYRGGAIAFHWTMFALVVIVGVLGLLHDSWPEATQAFWINVHALLGIALWLTLIGRFVYRLQHAPPALPENLGSWSRRFSSPVHWLMYALLFVIPLIGVVTFIYHGRIFDFGMFQIDPGVKKNHAVFGPTEDVHGYLAYALFALAGLHAAAALWHHFWLRDGVLRRMLPARRSREP